MEVPRYLGHSLSFRAAALRGAEFNSAPLIPMTGFREGRSPCLAKPLGKATGQSHEVKPRGEATGEATGCNAWQCDLIPPVKRTERAEAGGRNIHD